MRISSLIFSVLVSVCAFVEKCESNWKDAETEALNQRQNSKKNRENETINFFKRRTDEKNVGSALDDEKQKPQQRILPVEHNPAAAPAMMINFGVDNKKKPLNEYKGIFQRVMRKSRAIKNHKSIQNKKKKRTTDILVAGIGDAENTVHYNEEVEELEPEIEPDDEDVHTKVEDPEIDEDESDDDDDDDDEEEEDVSSIAADSDDEFKDSDSNSDSVGRADLDALGEKYQ